MQYLFAIGFVGILGQVVLLRELSVASYGIELIYILAIGIWLFSSACGAMISRREFHASFSRINFLFVLFSVSLPLDIAFVRSERLLFASTSGAYLPFHTQMIALCASILPLGLILGLLFQWTAKAYIKHGKSLAAAYGIESLGGLAGGICATLFLKFGFQNFCIGLLCSLCATGSVFLSGEARNAPARWIRIASVTLAGILLLLVWKAPALDRIMTSWTHPHLIATQDSPYARITVTLQDGQVSIFEDDALLFNTDGTHAEELVHIAALQHPKPERILVLGGGIWGTVREALAHSPILVDYVELNPALLAVASPHVPSEIQKSLTNEKVRITIDDPRKFLKRSLNYDLILVGMPEPASGQANRFYTKEFFQQCLSKLNAGGVLGFSLQSSENIWTWQQAQRIISVYQAARSAFPNVLVFPGETNIVVGSLQPLTKDPTLLASRLQSRGIRAKLVSAAFLKYLCANDRFAKMQSLLASGDATVNSDVRPICYQYTLMIWMSKLIPAFQFFDLRLWGFLNNRMSSLWCLIGLSLPFLYLSRTRWRFRRAVLAGIAGFAGMVLETAVMLYFQIKNGILYQDVGILLTGFLTGLASGALLISKTRIRSRKMLGVALLLGFAILSAFIGMGINLGKGAGLAGSLLLLFLTGFLVAGIFSYASMREANDQRDVITPMYSADLIGGCIGSVLSSLFLVPVAGLDTTAHLMAPLAIAAVLLL
jgi:spermidine synthase